MQITTANPTSICQLKGSLLPLTILELNDYDLTKIERELTSRHQQAPNFFNQVPVVIDLEKLGNQSIMVDFTQLQVTCRQFGLIPFAVRGGNDLLKQRAEQAGLAVLHTSKKEVTGEPAKTNEKKTRQCRIIDQPVRSGQQIYVADGDLIVTSSVSAGAELLADGNIHVYGPLRGRALAGVQGDHRARIFCSCLEAELISIAGRYKVSEDLQQEYHQQSVEIVLDDERLKIRRL